MVAIIRGIQANEQSFLAVNCEISQEYCLVGKEIAQYVRKDGVKCCGGNRCDVPTFSRKMKDGSIYPASHRRRQNGLPITDAVIGNRQSAIRNQKSAWSL